MRWLVAAAPVAFALIITSLFLPWGHKAVVDEACGGDWMTGRRCTVQDVDVDYLPLRMDVIGMEVHTDDGEVEDTRSLTGQRSYLATPPHTDGITPLILGAGPLMIIGAVLMLVAAAGSLFPTDADVWFQRFAVAGWGVMAGGTCLFLLGMGFHAFTWRAEHVEPWGPGWGLLAGLTAVATGAALIRRLRADGQGPLPTLPSPSERDRDDPSSLI